MKSKNLDIEVLRAIAIIGTLIAHIDILFYWGSSRFDAFKGIFFPWGGVDLFFCISGYVITGNLLRSLDKTQARSFAAFAIPFWIKRVWRILPSAWTWMLFPLILSIGFNRSGYLGSTTGNLVDGASIVAQMANFHFWYCYAVPSALCGINQVYWSLSLEEQSYILLPILLFFVSRRAVVPILCAIVVAQLFLHRPILSFLWFVRTDALAIGALIAIFRQSGVFASIEPRCLATRWASALTLVSLCLLLAAIPGALDKIPFHTGLLAIVAGGMVWIASYGNGYTLSDGLIKRVMVYIGSRSYAIYLIHFAMFHVTREIWLRVEGAGAVIDGHYSIRFLVTALSLTFLSAELNFRFLETPLRRYGARLAEKREAGRIPRAAVFNSVGDGSPD